MRAWRSCCGTHSTTSPPPCPTNPASPTARSRPVGAAANTAARCVVALLVFLIVGAVCAIGLLELSGASPDTHVIFYNGAPGTTGDGSRPLGR